MSKPKKKQTLSSEIIFSTLEDHTDILKKLSVRRIGLFGSFVRNNPKGQSDIDLLVDFSAPTLDNFMDLVTCLEKFFGKEVDLITEGSLSPYIRPYVEKEIRWYEVR